MPNKKAAIKHLKQTIKRTKFNSLVKRNIKEIIKKGKKSITDGSIKDNSQELIHKLQKTIDKAIKKGIIKRNTGNRKKSRFTKIINNTINKDSKKESS